jgi:hypothetical protein
MWPGVRKLLELFLAEKNDYLRTGASEQTIQVLGELADVMEEITQQSSELAVICRQTVTALRNEKSRQVDKES